MNKQRKINVKSVFPGIPTIMARFVVKGSPFSRDFDSTLPLHIFLIFVNQEICGRECRYTVYIQMAVTESNSKVVCDGDVRTTPLETYKESKKKITKEGTQADGSQCAQGPPPGRKEARRMFLCEGEARKT